MSAAPATIAGGQVMQVRVDLSGLERMLGVAPRSAYFWMRDFLFLAFQRHRVTWLRDKGSKFGRGGRGTKVWRINEGPAVPGPKDVAYNVLPRDRRMATVEAARAGLQELRAETFTGSEVLSVHEFGTPIRSTRWMAIATKGTRPKSPDEWVAAHPGKKLVVRRSRRNPATLLLFERTPPRSWLTVSSSRAVRRARAGAPTAAQSVKSQLRFVLTRFLQMKPTLHMYSTWDALVGDRDSRWRFTADRMLRDLENGRVD